MHVGNVAPQGGATLFKLEINLGCAIRPMRLGAVNMGLTQEPLPQSAKLTLIYIMKVRAPQNDFMVPDGVLDCGIAQGYKARRSDSCRDVGDILP